MLVNQCHTHLKEGRQIVAFNIAEHVRLGEPDIGEEKQSQPKGVAFYNQLHVE